jgi:hypothetical protein
MSTKLPNKFEFITSLTKHTYKMEKVGDTYYCSALGVDADPEWHTPWKVRSIQEALAEGLWTITKDLDPQEPELVFPFTYRHNGCDTEHIVVKGSDGTLKWMEDYPTTWDDLFSEDQLREDIKRGEIIILSVGEQPKPSQTRPEAPTSVVETLKVRVDSSEIKAATEAMNALAAGVENVNVSLESMQKLLAEMGLGNGGYVTQAAVGDFFEVEF